MSQTKRALLAGACALVLCAATPVPQVVPVRHPEGLVHGFLSLKTLDGRLLADGDLIQNAQGDRVTSRLVFHFKDGSLHDETVVYSQRRHFKMISDRLVQRGPAFPRSIDMLLDATTGRVTVRHTEDGKQKVNAEQFDLPPNLANGLVATLLKNVTANTVPESFALVAATPKPRLVTLVIRVAGVEPFATAGTNRKATHYVLKARIGGVTGLLASLFGKLPPDSHVWILGGEAPAFVRAEQPFYAGGPLWRIELVSPAWRGVPATSETGR